MNFLILLTIFIFGTIIGSFLNVVILRFGTKDSIVTGNSKCPRCGKELKFYELIPVLSWILQLGKCRKCDKKISIQYPLVEFFTGIIFVLNYILWSDNLFYFALTGIALSLLVVIFVYDLYHKIIPDTFSFTFGILSLVYLFLNFNGGDLSREVLMKWDLLAPVIFFMPFYLLWRLSNGTWIGLGDGKLVFGFGGFLGFAYGLSAIFLGFWIGAIFAIALMLIQRLRRGSKSITMKSEIAFGPFLIIGFLIVYFLKIDVTGLSVLLNGF